MTSAFCYLRWVRSKVNKGEEAMATCSSQQSSQQVQTQCFTTEHKIICSLTKILFQNSQHSVKPATCKSVCSDRVGMQFITDPSFRCADGAP